MNHIFRSLFFALLSAIGCLSVSGGPVHEVVASFERLPRNPINAPLVLGPDGNLWGASKDGGPLDRGTIYKVNPASGVLTMMVAFADQPPSTIGVNPTAGLVADANGFLWGSIGPVFGAYRYFKFDTATGTLTAESGSGPLANPSALVADGLGFLWGTTKGDGALGNGRVFKRNTASGVETTVVEFGSTVGPNFGASPNVQLVNDGNGFLWGTTAYGGRGNYGGTIFKIHAATGVLTTVEELDTPGAVDDAGFPLGGLVNDGNGFLWGTTAISASGDFNSGTVFKVNLQTGVRTTVSSFSDGPVSPIGELIADQNGFLWGAAPGRLFGTRRSDGEVFKVNVATGGVQAVFRFGRSSGWAPQAGLAFDDYGFLWGTTSESYNGSGTAGPGTVFKLNAGTGVFTSLVNFSGTAGANKGAYPASRLLNGGDGFMWGTTASGGAADAGTVYKVNQTTGVLTTVVEFTGAAGAVDGRTPNELLADGNGNFWGTTYSGGAGNHGTVFKVNSTTGVLTTVVEFTHDGTTNRGRYPNAGLTYDGNGFFWGTTGGQFWGVGSDSGTVFKVNVATGELTTIFEFSGRGGEYRGTWPHGALLNDGNGSMWGTTRWGGVNGTGTVFKVDIATGRHRVVIDFGDLWVLGRSTGATPLAGLVKHSDGYLYGCTYEGGKWDVGTVFRIDSDAVPPEVLLNGPTTTTIVALDGPYVDAGATATDLDWNPLTPTMTANTVQADVPGSYLVTWSATDGGGRTGSATRQVVVLAEPAPTITGTFSPLTILGRTPLPDYRTQAVTSNFHGAVTITQSPPPGGINSTTLVTLHAEDGDGREATLRLQVTVLPVTVGGTFSPLTIAARTPLPDYRTQLTTSNFSGTISTTQTPAPGTLHDGGIVNVVLSASDVLGNAARTSFDVTIPTPQLGGTYSPLILREGTLLADYTSQAVATEFASTPTVTQSPAPGTVLAAGQLIITLTASDASGNSVATSFQATVLAANPVRTVLASKGSTATVDGQSVVWNTFGVPSINDAGNGIAMATYAVGTARTTVVLAWDGANFSQSLKPIAKVGGPAPGIEGAVMRAIAEPLLGPDGAVAWVATLASASGYSGAVTSANERAIFLDPDGGGPSAPFVIARKGQAGAGTATLKAFTSLALSESTLAFTATLSGANTTTDSGIWMYDRSTASTVIALREDAPLLGSKVRGIAALAGRTGSLGQGRGLEMWDKEGATAVRMTLADGRQVIGRVTATGVTSSYVAGAAVSAAENGSKWLSFGLPTQSEGGALAFLGTVRADSAFYPAVFADSDSALSRIAAKGSPAPGVAGGVFSMFKDPVRAGNGCVLFHGTLAAANGVTLSNNDGIWLSDGAAGLALIAREGTHATGTPDGTNWRAFTSLALPETRGPLFVATLANGGVTSANDTGLWATDGLGGHHLLIREGDAFAGARVRSFTVLSSVLGSPAQTRSFNNNGGVILRVTDTTGAQHLVQIAVP